MGNPALFLLVFGCAVADGAALLFLMRRKRVDAHTIDSLRRRLQRDTARLRTLVHDSSEIMAIIDGDGNVLHTSGPAGALFGTVDDDHPSSFFAHVHPDDRERALGAVARLHSSPAPVVLECRLGDGTHTWRDLELVVSPLGDGADDSVVITAHDSADRRQAAVELQEAEARFGTAFEHAPIGMALASLDGSLTRVNRALIEILGRPEGELVGTSLADLAHPDDRVPTREALDRLIAGDVPICRIEQRHLHHDGRPVWVAFSASLVRNIDGEPLYIVGQIEDITERKASGARLAHQAIHDPLTGLPNRLLFVNRLERALVTSFQTGNPFAVLFLDVDRFKLVNDGLGHAAGDRMLVVVADRLRQAVRPTDTVARFGGDEFTILCEDVRDRETARVVAERLSNAVCQPVALAEGEVFVTVSIGIALSSDDGSNTAETMMRNADTAMYHAKQLGRARSEIYDNDSRARVVDNLRTGNDLHRAIERGELRLHYQPIIDLETGRLYGFESLIRWEHPERGLVPPSDFIPLAEETGLIVPVGLWTLETACRQVKWWHDQHPENGRLGMSVNLSPRQLSEPQFAASVAQALRNTGVDPTTICFEITETMIMHNADAAITALGALRALGVHLAIDDFGSGYSSLGYLDKLPVESLKIDKTFVDNIGTGRGSATIATAVVSLAHALGLRAVAEGIETPEQLAELRTVGCDLGQGYLFGRPQPADVYGANPVEMVSRWGHLTRPA